MSGDNEVGRLRPSILLTPWAIQCHLGLGPWAEEGPQAKVG